MNGIFKTVYAPSLLDLVPDFAILQKRIPFASADKQIGNFYAQPVNLAHEAGFTYNGEAGTVVTLNDAVNGVTKEAQVKGSELILKTQMAYMTLARAAQQGEKAFKRASSFKIEDMNDAMRKRLEVAMLYGRVGIGTVSALSSQIITISDGSWAGGIWAGAENAIVDVYQSNLSTLRQGGLQISKVDSDNKQLTVVGTTTGIVAGDVVFFKGANSAGTFNEMAGLQAIVSNNTTLFNIDASVFSLWKGNLFPSFGPPSFARFQEAISRAVNKGLMEEVLLLVSPKCWGVLNSDQAALREFDSSYSVSKGEVGNESLVFHSVNGKVEIVSHPMVKDGDAFILPLKSVSRIGSLDVSFDCPGFEEKFFRYVEGKNAVELQCYTDQAIFIDHPAHAVYVSGITYP